MLLFSLLDTYSHMSLCEKKNAMINKLAHLLFLTAHTTPKPRESEFLCVKTDRLEARELDEEFEVRRAPRAQRFPHTPECPPQPSRSRGLTALPSSGLR